MVDQNGKSLKVLSFGGGRQTVAIVAMCLNGEFEKPDHIIFADTQCESKTTYVYNEFIKQKLKGTGIEYHQVSIGNIVENSLSRNKFASIPFFTKMDGEPGMLRRQCTNEYKIQPVYQKIREIIGLKPYQRYDGIVELWIGYSADEIKRADRMIKNKKVKWITPRFPLIEKKIYVDNCIEYLKRIGWGEPEKSACWMCPFKSDLEWKKQKEYYPDEFAKAVKYEKEIKNHKVSIKSDVYLHRSLKPLDQVEFDSQSELFGCKWGVCGL